MTTRVALTLEEFLTRPETKPASEYIDGEIVRKPMPDRRHVTLQAWLVTYLLTFVDARGWGRVGTEWRCVFGPPGRRRAYVPDLVYSAFTSVPRGDARAENSLKAPPDLAIEILSRNDRPGRIARKLAFYLTYGVRLVWIVDPRRQTITVHQPGAHAVTLTTADTLDGSSVLPGFQLSIAALMARLVE